MSDFSYPLHEECGVFGIYDRAGTEDVAAAAYSALYALQHRGQESCGIAVNDDGVIVGHRDLGLVNEVFTPAVLASLANPNAHMATGHVRYATAGSRVRANAQPMIVRHGRGTMALCHNGNLTNAIELRRQLENEGAIFHGSSDTEVICYLVTRNRLRMGSIEIAISKTMDVLEGAYSLVVMSATKLIAARDPRGYRPLCIGTLPGGGYVFASESCALDAVGATLLRDVEPGEIVITDTKTGELRSIKDHCGRPDRQMCVFEFIYFARPDIPHRFRRCRNFRQCIARRRETKRIVHPAQLLERQVALQSIDSAGCTPAINQLRQFLQSLLHTCQIHSRIHFASKDRKKFRNTRPPAAAFFRKHPIFGPKNDAVT